jgi:hypothetical protein
MPSAVNFEQVSVDEDGDRKTMARKIVRRHDERARFSMSLTTRLPMVRIERPMELTSAAVP